MIAALIATVPALAQAGTVMQTTYSCTDAQGKSTLTNVPNPSAQCEALYTTEVVESPTSSKGGNAAPVASSTPAPASKAAAQNKSPEAQAKAAADRSRAKSAAAKSAKNYRDQAVRETANAYARGTPQDGNPAVTRRYLKTDRATYMQQNSVVPK
jgi:hypothetical protein